MTHTALIRHVLTALGMIVMFARSGSAQSRQYEVGAGAVTPRGSLGAQRDGGPLVRAAVTFTDASGHWRLRVDAHAALLRGQNNTDVAAVPSRDLQLLGAMVDLTAGPSMGAIHPHAIVGAGVQMLRVRGASGESSTVPALRGGAGVRLRVKRVQLLLEITPTYAFTSRGTGYDVWLVSYVPVSLGISF